MQRRILSAAQTGVNVASASVAVGDVKIEIKNAKKVALMITRATHTSGSGAFELHGSIDGGTTFFQLPLIEPIANTNAQTIARVTSKTLASNTSALLFLEEMFANLTHLSIKYTKTTDGTGSAALLIEDELMS